jgi:hypothetical protein
VMSLPRPVSAASRSSMFATSASREEKQPVLEFEKIVVKNENFAKKRYKNELIIYLHFKKTFVSEDDL